MEINRNQWFLIGMVLLFLGTQFRVIDSFILTPELTDLLEQRSGNSVASAGNPADAVAAASKSGIRRVIRPPEFVGWALLSLSATLVLHALGMKKPA